ncbi:MAG TPA: hybrid sensor histidine kinase/response regulator [Telluria sp.]|nr:hybrid sensor histidine kinase/response regulator [Telluria sp.]
MACVICVHPAELAAELPQGVGAILVADEALTADCLKSLGHFLKNQQTWSDLPVLVLSKRGLDSTDMRDRYLALGNVTLLERPVQGLTLVSAATAALRARRRQYEMREIDRRKDEFLAMLAHELRNPLAPVSAASDLLRLPNLDPARIQQTSEIISRQVRHMTGLIDDLLDLSRVSRGLVTLEEARVDVRQVMNEAVEQVRPLIDTRRHRLAVHVPPEPAFVHGDQKRLIQIIANLLNNAAKYTPEGGDIALTMDVNRTEVIFSVTDNGIGMDPHVIEHVFEMFSQAERTSDRSQGGLGIGLALVKRLVDLHGGRIAAQSDGVGKGSRFTLTLPRTCAANAMQAAAPADHLAVAADGHRLLIVDDNLDAAVTLGMFLELAGYRVMVEHTAEAAIARAQAHPPDACLLDIGLPDMDGIELAKRLRAAPDTSRSMLVAITGYGQESDRQKTLESGFDYHFVKPIDMDKLLGALSGLR